MQLLDRRRATWDQPDDYDHPALLLIIALVGLAMFSLICVYG
jgi:hypothetical protein